MCVYVRVYVHVCTAAESNKSMSSNVNVHDESLIQDIANKYNNALAFAADEDRMAYTIRDPLTSGLYLQGYASLGVMIMAHFVIYLCSYQWNLPNCDAVVKFTTNLANELTNIPVLLFDNNNKIIN